MDTKRCADGFGIWGFEGLLRECCPWGHRSSARRIWLCRMRHLQPSSSCWEVPGDRGLGKYISFYSRNGHCHRCTLEGFNSINLPAVSTKKPTHECCQGLSGSHGLVSHLGFPLLAGPSCSTSPPTAPQGFFKALLGVGTDFLEIFQSLWLWAQMGPCRCPCARKTLPAAPRTPLLQGLG